MDDLGNWIKCTAHGRNAIWTGLRDLQRIVAFFGTGRKGLKDHPGRVYFMKDSVLVAITKDSDVPKAKKWKSRCEKRRHRLYG